MIDITKETLVLFTDTPKVLPKQKNGKHIHLSALYRWKNQGIAGVRLETVFVAGGRYTSREALNRFWEAVTAAKDRVSVKTSVGKSSSANDELQAAGW